VGSVETGRKHKIEEKEGKKFRCMKARAQDGALRYI